MESRVREFTEQRSLEEDEAESSAQDALRQAQERLDRRVAAVEERDDLDAQAKQIMARNLQEVENRRFSVLEANINAEKDAQIRASEERMEAQIPPHPERNPYGGGAAAADPGVSCSGCGPSCEDGRPKWRARPPPAASGSSDR